MKIRLSDLTRELSPQEIDDIVAAESKGVEPDDDCPEMTKEQLSQFFSGQQHSERALRMMDESSRNQRKDIVSNPIKLTEFRE